MATFEGYEDLKAELRDRAPESAKETRASAVRVLSDLDDAVDEAIEVFTALNPEAMAEFDARVELKRANADAFGAPRLATKLERQMEVRSECWFPTVQVAQRGPRGRVRTRYMSLQSVLNAIYHRHGFEDFPNAKTRAEFLMLKDFKRRHPRFFVAEEL